MSHDPKVFGPVLWGSIHFFSSAATTEDKRRLYVEYINNLTITLPCEKCRKHFIQNIADFPVEPYANTNVGLFYHSWKLHDTVNNQLKKPKEQCLTFEQAFEVYFGKPPPPNAIIEEHVPEYNSPDPEIKDQLIQMRQKHLEESHSNCKNCGGDVKYDSKKQSYEEFRAQQRKKFTSKNA
jgi:hypothetical protein